MKHIIYSILFATLLFATGSLFGQIPDVLYYNFDEPGLFQINYGSDKSAAPFAEAKGGLTIGGTGAFGSTGLAGSGASSSGDYFETGWPLNLYQSWTIGFWFDAGAGGSGIHYLFGDSAAYGFSCYVDYSSSPDDLVITAPGYPGWTDVIVSGGAGPGPKTVHLAYDNVLSEIRFYVDGNPLGSTPQPLLNLNGFSGVSSNLKLGGHLNLNGLPAGAVLDEFRVYSTSLTDNEVLLSWNVNFALEPLALDLASDGLVSPAYTGAPWTSAETVTVGVRNHGAAEIDFSVSGLEVGVQVEGPNPTTISTVINTGTLATGERLSVDLLTGYNMADSGTYRFTTWLSLLGGLPDLDTDNDTSNPILRQQHMVDFLPYQMKFEKFESGGDGTWGPAPAGILYENWTAIPASGMTWWVEDATGLNENTSGTGPFLDNGKFEKPGGNYIYLESDAGPADEAILQSPVIDFDGSNFPHVGYSIHAFGAGIGTMYVEAQNTGTAGWVKIDSVTGALQLSGDEDWKMRTADLSAFAGNKVQVRFRALTTGLPDGDIALDEIHFFDLYTEDAAVLLPALPDAGVCGFTAEESLGIKITNNGSGFLTGFDINVNQDGPVTASFTENVGTLVIPPGATANVRLNTPLDLSLTGYYNIHFSIGIPGDILPVNDTVTAGLLTNTAASISAFPYEEDYSVFSSWTTVDWAGDTLNNWVMQPGSWSGMGAAGPIRWRYSNGFPLSWITGPSDDHTAGGDGFLYLFPGGTIFTSAELYSPCVDLRTLPNPVLSFWFHMFGANMGTLSLSIVSEISGENLVFSRTGQQHADNDSPWTQELVDLSEWKDEVVRLHFKGKRKELTTTYMSVDDLKISDNTPQDVGVNSISTPLSSCGLAADHQFEVELVNNGADTIFSIPLEVNITGPIASTITETALVTIFPFSTSEFTFTITADLSVHGNYNVRIRSAYIGDANPLNDTAFITLSNNPSLVTYPLVEDFETYTVGAPGTYANGWTGNWYVEMDGVSNTAGTGPIGDHTPGGMQYMYQEGNAPDTFVSMKSLCMEADPSRPLFMDFRFYRYGDDVGPLTARINSGGKSNVTVNITGEQHPEEDLRWLRRVVNLNPLLEAEDIQVEFQGEKLGVLSDQAIDDVHIFYPDSFDAEALVLQVLPSCSPASTEVMIAVYNYGLAFSGTMDVEVLSTGPVNSGFIETIIGTIVPFQAQEYQLTSTIDLGVPGTYEIRLITHLTGDVNSSNDTLVFEYEALPPVSAFPYIEDLETGVPGAAGFLPSDWASFPGRNPSWQSGRDLTPSLMTGPPGNHTAGGETYIYLENTPSFHSDTSVLLSTCIDLDPAALGIPWLKYWFHMYGNDIGALALDVITPAAVYNDVWNIAGEQHCASCPWERSDVSLVPWLGEKIQLRFRALSGGDLSDMGLDDFEIYEPTGLDAAATAAKISTGFCRVPDEDSVQIRIKNISALPLSGFDVGYDVFGPDAQSHFENVGALVIPPFDSVDYRMSVPLTIDEGGIHDVAVWVSISGDIELNNDTAWLRYAWYPTPWSDDFEAFTVGEPGILANGWSRPDLIPGRGWMPELSGVPNSANTGPIEDHTSSSGIYMYLEDPTLILDEWTLFSPCVDLEDLTSPILDFWYHMYGSGMGDMLLEIQLNDGLFDTIALISGQQQFSELESWKRSVHSLTAYDGRNVRFRFTGKNGGERSDMAIDDFRIAEDFGSGINELTSNFDIFPNPAENHLMIRFKEVLKEDLLVQVIDRDGRIRLESELKAGSDNKVFDLQPLSDGIYIVVCKGAESRITQSFARISTIR